MKYKLDKYNDYEYEKRIANFLWKSRENKTQYYNLKDIIMTILLITISIFIAEAMTLWVNMFWTLAFLTIMMFFSAFLIKYSRFYRLLPLHSSIIEEIQLPNSIKYFFLLDKNNRPNYDVLFIDNGDKTTGLTLFKIKAPSKKLFYSFNEFVRGLYEKKDVPLFWYQVQEPVEYKDFIELDCITEKAKNKLLMYPRDSRESLLVVPGGIWRTTIIFGTKGFTVPNAPLNELKLLLKKLEVLRIKLLTNFKGVSSGIPISPLTKKELFSLVNSLMINQDCEQSVFYQTGIENVNHFLNFPKMAIKSLKSKYPAEFTVPTDLPYDIGPLGYSIEPEFQSTERSIGLYSKELGHGLLSVGAIQDELFKINTLVLYEAVIQEYSFIIITSNKKYRKMLQYIDNLTIFPYKKYGIDIFNDEGFEREKYISELEKIFKISLSLDQDAPLYSILIEIYNEGNRSIDGLIRLIEDKIKNEGTDMNYRDRQAINTLKETLELLLKSETAKFFELKNLPIDNRLHNSIFEIDIRQRKVKKIVIFLLLLKFAIKSIVDQNFGKNLIILIDDADFIFHDERPYSHGNLTERELTTIEFLKFLKRSGVIPFLSISNPKDIIPDIINELGNAFVSNMKIFDNIMAIRQVLNLNLNRGQKTEEHKPTFYSELRKYGYQFEYLSDMAPNEFLLKRPGVRTCFPISIRPLEFNNINYSDDQILNRTYTQIPELRKTFSIPDYETVLEKDFKGDQDDINSVLEILEILMEYPRISLSAIISATSLNQKEVDYFIKSLKKCKYIRAEQVRSGAFNRYEIIITDKGRSVYREYIHLKKRLTDDENE
ncbi:MAG: hypothetical protein ACTSQO_06765 [Candidatus Helarchaeota archaeon]